MEMLFRSENVPSYSREVFICKLRSRSSIAGSHLQNGNKVLLLATECMESPGKIHTATVVLTGV